MRMILAVEVPAKKSCTKTPQGGSTSMGDFKTSSVKLGITKIATDQTISGNIFRAKMSIYNPVNTLTMISSNFYSHFTGISTVLS